MQLQTMVLNHLEDKPIHNSHQEEIIIIDQIDYSNHSSIIKAVLQGIVGATVMEVVLILSLVQVQVRIRVEEVVLALGEEDKNSLYVIFKSRKTFLRLFLLLYSQSYNVQVWPLAKLILAKTPVAY